MRSLTDSGPKARVHRGLGALLALALVLVGCQPESYRPLRVGLLVWPAYEIFFLAEHLGYFNSSTIKLVDFSANSNALDAFDAGDIDALCVTTDLYLTELGNNPDAKIIMLVDISDGADALIAQSEISSVGDLKGKKVGLARSSLARYFLTRALGSADLMLKDVQLRYMDVNGQFEAFRSGKVDAVAGFEPTVTDLIKSGGHRIFDSKDIPGEIVDVLIVRNEMIETREAELQELTDGFFRARTYLLENPDDAAGIVAPRELLTSAEYLDSLDAVRLPDLEENRRMLTGTDPPLVATMKTVQAVLQATGSGSTFPDLSSSIDARFIEHATP